MIQRLQEYLNECEKPISENEKLVAKLKSKIEFCEIHNFHEEKRIAVIAYDCLRETTQQLRVMKDSIQTFINEWEQ